MEQTTVRIVQMSRHFLYLPLYFAQHNKFFGLLPPEFAIEIVNAEQRTDQSAFDMLMDTTSDARRGIDFAICDPTLAIASPLGKSPHPCVVAGLITNAAFWAVDRRSHNVTFLRDLASFDKIIAFKQGTTSYGIASRVFKDVNRAPSIYCVDPEQELVALEGSHGTVALSPNVLGIEHLVSNQREFNVDLALGMTPEYNNVLVTALITRSDVVTLKNTLVIGLLHALQQAILMVASEDSEVLDYARDGFSCSREVARRALTRAREGQVFPANIEVNEAHWINAARAATDALGTVWDDTAHARAKTVFATSIDPHRHIAAGIQKLLWRPRPEPSSRITPELLGGVGLALLIGGISLGKWLSFPGAVTTGLLAYAFLLPYAVIDFGKHRLAGIAHFVLSAVVVASTVGFFLQSVPLSEFVAIAAASFAADVGVIGTLEFRRRRGK